MRKLSSGMTWFYKFVFPTLWLGGFGAGSIVLLASWSSVLRENPNFPILMFPAAFVIGLVLFYFTCIRLKSVSIDGSVLVISNYQTELRIPIHEVAEVTGSIFWNPELLFLHLKHSTQFGKTIVFMAPMRIFGGYTRHPLVGELNQMLGLKA